MSGERPSVRFPSRTVPICVSEPIGFASPRRTASTPAMVVVLTAPMPTSKMPSFPVASAIFVGFFTAGDYISMPKVPKLPKQPKVISVGLFEAVGSKCWQ
jgi:hypothetical protein